MSNPREDDKERANRKVCGNPQSHLFNSVTCTLTTVVCPQMSAQEYELIQNEDERGLKRYRKQCMQEMHERLSFGPKFECVHELESGEAFLEVIEKEHRSTLVVVHIYQNAVKSQSSP